MFGQLGDIKFQGVLGPSDFTQTKAVNYAEHAVIEGKPRLQRVGDKLDDLVLGIMFHVSFCDPEAEILKLEQAMSAGDVSTYINGAGDVYGDFVITDISKTFQHLTPDGRILYATLQVTLKEMFSVDLVRDRQDKQKTQAFANEGNSPVKSPVNEDPQSQTAAASGSLQTAVSENENINKELNDANNESPVNTRHFDKVLDSIDKMNESLNDSANRINGFVGDIASETNAILGQITVVQNTLSVLGGLVALADLPNSIAQLTNVNDAVYDLRSISSSLVRIVVARR